MDFHTIRLGELPELEKYHPAVWRADPTLPQPILPQDTDPNPDFPILFYCEEGRDLACYIRCFPDTLHVAGRAVPLAWNGNLLTLPEFRRRGLARAIVECQMQEFARTGTVWGGVFSAPAALRLYEKLSFSMVGTAPRLCFVRSTTAFLDHHMPTALARVAGGLGAGAARLLDRALRLRQPFRSTVSSREISKADFAGLAAAGFAAPQGQAHWDHSPDWLLRRQSVRDIDHIHLVERSGGGDPVGYIVVRQRRNLKRPIREKYYGVDVMSLMHYGAFSDDRDANEMLLAAALNLFAASDADMFEVVTSDPALREAARRAGLFPLGGGMSFKFHASEALTELLPTDLAAYKLTHYSGDGFSFE
jgi:GNAT superfamily N-acetyltransferase